MQIQLSQDNIMRVNTGNVAELMASHFQAHGKPLPATQSPTSPLAYYHTLTNIYMHPKKNQNMPPLSRTPPQINTNRPRPSPVSAALQVTTAEILMTIIFTLSPWCNSASPSPSVVSLGASQAAKTARRPHTVYLPLNPTH